MKKANIYIATKKKRRRNKETEELPLTSKKEFFGTTSEQKKGAMLKCNANIQDHKKKSFKHESKTTHYVKKRVESTVEG